LLLLSPSIPNFNLPSFSNLISSAAWASFV
jgi:hypothetical protein